MTREKHSPSSAAGFDEELGRLLERATLNDIDVEGAWVHTTDDGRTWELLITAVDTSSE